MNSTPTNTESIPAWEDVQSREDEAGKLAEGVTTAKPDPFHSGTVYQIKGWRLWLLLKPAALLLRLYYATLRISITSEEETVLRDKSRPVVGIAWHNRSFIMPMVFRRFRSPDKCYCLISPSKPAAWEDAIFHLLGIPSARGSSSRRSIQAMRELIHENKKGNDIYISPDGPTGPIYVFKRGAAAAARMTKAPILLMGVESRSAYRANSWDHHFFPLPFSKVHVRAILLENANVFDGQRDDDAVCNYLAGKLKSISAD